MQKGAMFLEIATYAVFSENQTGNRSVYANLRKGWLCMEIEGSIIK